MTQSRRKLLEVLASHLATAVVHRILEKAIDSPEIASRYRKETLNALEVAKKYRERLNPKMGALPEQEMELLRNRVVRKVKAALQVRISKGYTGIRYESIEDEVMDALSDLHSEGAT